MGVVVLRSLASPCLQQLITAHCMSGFVVNGVDFWDAQSGKLDDGRIHRPPRRLLQQQQQRADRGGAGYYRTPHDELNNLTCTFVLTRR